MSHKQINVRWATQSDKPAIARLLHGLMAHTASLYGKPESEIKSVETVRAELDRTISMTQNTGHMAARAKNNLSAPQAVLCSLYA